MTASSKVKLKPGDTIGILGGGQLGRMLAMAAARLGLKCQVFSPDPDSPAFDVVLNATCAEYADVEALELFANDVDVITYEFENVPAATAMVLAARISGLPPGQEGRIHERHPRTDGTRAFSFPAPRLSADERGRQIVLLRVDFRVPVRVWARHP